MILKLICFVIYARSVLSYPNQTGDENNNEVVITKAQELGEYTFPPDYLFFSCRLSANINRLSQYWKSKDTMKHIRKELYLIRSNKFATQTLNEIVSEFAQIFKNKTSQIAILTLVETVSNILSRFTLRNLTYFTTSYNMLNSKPASLQAFSHLVQESVNILKNPSGRQLLLALLNLQKVELKNKIDQDIGNNPNEEELPKENTGTNELLKNDADSIGNNPNGEDLPKENTRTNELLKNDAESISNLEEDSNANTLSTTTGGNEQSVSKMSDEGPISENLSNGKIETSDSDVGERINFEGVVHSSTSIADGVPQLETLQNEDNLNVENIDSTIPIHRDTVVKEKSITNEGDLNKYNDHTVPQTEELDTLQYLPQKMSSENENLGQKLREDIDIDDMQLVVEEAQDSSTPIENVGMNVLSQENNNIISNSETDIRRMGKIQQKEMDALNTISIPRPENKPAINSGTVTSENDGDFHIGIDEGKDSSAQIENTDINTPSKVKDSERTIIPDSNNSVMEEQKQDQIDERNSVIEEINHNLDENEDRSIGNEAIGSNTENIDSDTENKSINKETTEVVIELENELEESEKLPTKKSSANDEKTKRGKQSKNLKENIFDERENGIPLKMGVTDTIYETENKSEDRRTDTNLNTSISDDANETSSAALINEETEGIFSEQNVSELKPVDQTNENIGLSHNIQNVAVSREISINKEFTNTVIERNKSVEDLESKMNTSADLENTKGIKKELEELRRKPTDQSDLKTELPHNDHNINQKAQTKEENDIHLIQNVSIEDLPTVSITTESKENFERPSVDNSISKDSISTDKVETDLKKLKQRDNKNVEDDDKKVNVNQNDDKLERNLQQDVRNIKLKELTNEKLEGLMIQNADKSILESSLDNKTNNNHEVEISQEILESESEEVTSEEGNLNTNIKIIDKTHKQKSTGKLGNEIEEDEEEDTDDDDDDNDSGFENGEGESGEEDNGDTESEEEQLVIENQNIFEEKNIEIKTSKQIEEIKENPIGTTKLEEEKHSTHKTSVENQHSEVEKYKDGKIDVVLNSDSISQKLVETEAENPHSKVKKHEDRKADVALGSDSISLNRVETEAESMKENIKKEDERDLKIHVDIEPDDTSQKTNLQLKELDDKNIKISDDINIDNRVEESDFKSTEENSVAVQNTDNSSHIYQKDINVKKKYEPEENDNLKQMKTVEIEDKSELGNFELPTEEKLELEVLQSSNNENSSSTDAIMNQNDIKKNIKASKDNIEDPKFTLNKEEDENNLQEIIHTSDVKGEKNHNESEDIEKKNPENISTLDTVDASGHKSVREEKMDQNASTETNVSKKLTVDSDTDVLDPKMTKNEDENDKTMKDFENTTSTNNSEDKRKNKENKEDKEDMVDNNIEKVIQVEGFNKEKEERENVKADTQADQNSSTTMQNENKFSKTNSESDVEDSKLEILQNENEGQTNSDMTLQLEENTQISEDVNSKLTDSNNMPPPRGFSCTLPTSNGNRENIQKSDIEVVSIDEHENTQANKLIDSENQGVQGNLQTGQTKPSGMKRFLGHLGIKFKS